MGKQSGKSRSLSVELVTNASKPSHGGALLEALAHAQQVWIAVGFLKDSGFQWFSPQLESLVQSGGRSRVYVGLSLYITEPQALRNLMGICAGGADAVVYLCDPPKETFHPKVYCFRGRGESTVFVGSANLTGAGMASNIEQSACVRGGEDSAFLSDVVDSLQAFEKQKWCYLANDVLVDRYERKYDIMHKAHAKADAAAMKLIAALRDFDLAVMHDHVDSYRAIPAEQEDFERRRRNYKEAARILNKLATTSSGSAKTFLDLYGRLIGAAGMGRLWHSGSLFRSKTKVAHSRRGFGEVLNAIRSNIDTTPEDLFRIARESKAENAVDGLGVNVITEMMNTLAPSRYPVLNSNPLGSLGFFGFKDFPSPGNFKSATYQVFADLLQQIATEFGFEDLGRVDHFMNFVYWREYAKIKGKK